MDIIILKAPYDADSGGKSFSFVRSKLRFMTASMCKPLFKMITWYFTWHLWAIPVSCRRTF